MKYREIIILSFVIIMMVGITGCEHRGGSLTQEQPDTSSTFDGASSLEDTSGDPIMTTITQIVNECKIPPTPEEALECPECFETGGDTVVAANSSKMMTLFENMMDMGMIKMDMVEVEDDTTAGSDAEIPSELDKLLKYIQPIIPFNIESTDKLPTVFFVYRTELTDLEENAYNIYKEKEEKLKAEREAEREAQGIAVEEKDDDDILKTIVGLFMGDEDEAEKVMNFSDVGIFITGSEIRPDAIDYGQFLAGAIDKIARGEIDFEMNYCKNVCEDMKTDELQATAWAALENYDFIDTGDNKRKCYMIDKEAEICKSSARMSCAEMEKVFGRDVETPENGGVYGHCIVTDETDATVGMGLSDINDMTCEQIMTVLEENGRLGGDRGGDTYGRGCIFPADEGGVRIAMRKGQEVFGGGYLYALREGNDPVVTDMLSDGTIMIATQNMYLGVRSASRPISEIKKDDLAKTFMALPGDAAFRFAKVAEMDKPATLITGSQVVMRKAFFNSATLGASVPKDIVRTAMAFDLAMRGVDENEAPGGDTTTPQKMMYDPHAFPSIEHVFVMGKMFVDKYDKRGDLDPDQRDTNETDAEIVLKLNLSDMDPSMPFMLALPYLGLVSDGLGIPLPAPSAPAVTPTP